MSVIAPLAAFLHFVHFETKIMRAFSREISINTWEKKRKYPSVKKQVRVF